MAKLKDARGVDGFNEVWSSDVKIIRMEEPSSKQKVFYVDGNFLILHILECLENGSVTTVFLSYV